MSNETKIWMYHKDWIYSIYLEDYSPEGNNDYREG